MQEICFEETSLVGGGVLPLIIVASAYAPTLAAGAALGVGAHFFLC